MFLVMMETNLYKREQLLDCSHSRFGGKVLHFLNPPPLFIIKLTTSCSAPFILAARTSYSLERKVSGPWWSLS